MKRSAADSDHGTEWQFWRSPVSSADALLPARRSQRFAGALHRSSRQWNSLHFDLPSQRQSSTRPQVHLQTGLVRAPDRIAAQLLKAGVPVVLAGDYTVVSTPGDIYPTRSLDKTRSFNLGAAKPSRAFSPRAGPTRCASCNRTGRCGRSGITSSGAGRPIKACGWRSERQ
jgi:hypothetical protein